MNKKFLTIIIVAAIAVLAGWNINQSKNEVMLSDLALANIDALAFRTEDPNEGRGMIAKKCYNSNGVEIGAKCESSTSHTDICHYQNDQWGKCN